MDPSTFQRRLLAWFERHGRKDLPWQKDISPYRVWLSETMLQQTQVATVIPYFNRFVESFPDLETLAQAPIDDVLRYWSGLGYYARARNLHKTARLIAERGSFPDTLDELMALPGIGRSTAGAILSIAFNDSHPILDGNVRRVLARFRAVPGWPGTGSVDKALWTLSAMFTPESRVAAYTQAIMDLGATLCTRNNPGCGDCPLADDCRARISGNVLAFPHPKPAKTLPVKQLVLLILRDRRGRILLEKRPAAGIWGGLWSLPEFDSAEAAQNWCLINQMDMLSQQLLPVRRHSFSHYHLDYTPLAIQIDDSGSYVAEADRTVWHSAEEISALGLPAPVKQLLQVK